jgi:hypothetical protein
MSSLHKACVWHLSLQMHALRNIQSVHTTCMFVGMRIACCLLAVYWTHGNHGAKGLRFTSFFGSSKPRCVLQLGWAAAASSWRQWRACSSTTTLTLMIFCVLVSTAQAVRQWLTATPFNDMDLA